MFQMKFDFNSTPALKSKRLILRLVNHDDGEAVLFLRSDKEVNKYISRPKPKDLEEAAAFITKTIDGIRVGEIIYWAITLTNDDQMIGSICLWNFSSDFKRAEIGYDLSPRLQNQGIMSESMSLVLEFGFKELGLYQIEAFTHFANASSIRLLKKFGFKLMPDLIDENNKNNRVFHIHMSHLKNISIL